MDSSTMNDIPVPSSVSLPQQLNVPCENSSLGNNPSTVTLAPQIDSSRLREESFDFSRLTDDIPVNPSTSNTWDFMNWSCSDSSNNPLDIRSSSVDPKNNTVLSPDQFLEAVDAFFALEDSTRASKDSTNFTIAISNSSTTVEPHPEGATGNAISSAAPESGASSVVQQDIEKTIDPAKTVLNQAISPKYLYMNDSSPASDHDTQQQPSLDGSSTDRSSKSGNQTSSAFQLQDYLMPPLLAFGRRVGNEDDPLVGDRANLSEMLAYPDETPIITLGRGKKKTRSLSQMSQGEVQEALNGFVQRQAIHDWSGACSNALLSNPITAWNPPSTTTNVESVSSIHVHPQPSAEHNRVNPAPAPVQDWKARNKLHLTVNTDIQMIKRGELSQPAYPESLQVAGRVPSQSSTTNGIQSPRFDMFMEGMKSAPPMLSQIASFGSCYPASLTSPLLPTPPYTATLMESQSLQTGFPPYFHPQYASYHPSTAHSVPSVPAPYTSSSLYQPLQKEFGHFESLPTPSSATMSALLTPASAHFPMLPFIPSNVVTSDYHTGAKLNSKGDSNQASSYLPLSPPMSAGIQTTPFDLGSTFGHLSQVSRFPEQTKLMNASCPSSVSTPNLTQDALSVFNADYNRQLIQSNKRMLDDFQQFGYAGNVNKKPKMNYSDHDVSRATYHKETPANKIREEITLNIHGLTKLPYGVGSRLKPGPKSKSTLVQHPPLNQSILSGISSLRNELLGGLSAGVGVSKDILRCLYEPIHQRNSDEDDSKSTASGNFSGPNISKKYLCKIENCGRIFPRKTAIESHIQTHLEDKPFVCPVRDCNAAFVRQHDLRRHEHIHSGNKPFNCDCGKGFARGDALMRHRQRGICVGSMIPRRC